MQNMIIRVGQRNSIVQRLHFHTGRMIRLCYPSPMKNLAAKLASLLVAAWVGGIWAVGYLAVPVLFYGQPDRQLAGMLAGQMFTLVNYLGLACGAYLLAWQFGTAGRASFRQALFRIVAVMLLITVVLQFGFQPVMAGLKLKALPLDVMHSTYAGQFRMLHGMSSIFYLIQSLLGMFLVIRFTKPDNR